MVLGDRGVGKTALIKRYVDGMIILYLYIAVFSLYKYYSCILEGIYNETRHEESIYIDVS